MLYAVIRDSYTGVFHSYTGVFHSSEGDNIVKGSMVGRIFEQYYCSSHCQLATVDVHIAIIRSLCILFNCTVIDL